MSRKAKNQSPPPVPENEVVEELDGTQIARPEHFFRPGVCGITVPRQFQRDGKAGSDWLTYLQWNDGRREVRPLPDAVDVNGQKVFLLPVPGASSRPTCPAWSKQSRTEWLQRSPGVAPDALWRMLRDTLARYIDMPAEVENGTFHTLACWIVLTYIFQVFDAVPYLLLTGPANSGKSRVMEVLAQLVFRPLVTSNLSPASLFRSLDLHGGTALLDEAERLTEQKAPDVQELLSVLLGGYRNNGGALRCEKDNKGGIHPRHFYVFGPKVFACINGVPPAFASRCIVVRMLRSPPGSRKHLNRFAADQDNLQAVRDALHCAALSFGADWIALPRQEDLCVDWHCRDYELWQPLFAIAAWFEQHGVTGILPELRQHALHCISSSKEAVLSPEDEALLQSLTAEVRAGQRPTADRILQGAKKQDNALFSGWTPKRASIRLAAYGVRSDGKHRFSPSPTALLAIQESYGFRLGLVPPPTSDKVPQRAPSAPTEGSDGHVGHVGARPQQEPPNAT